MRHNVLTMTVVGTMLTISRLVDSVISWQEARRVKKTLGKLGQATQFVASLTEAETLNNAGVCQKLENLGDLTKKVLNS